jgi:hypothetical protein
MKSSTHIIHTYESFTFYFKISFLEMGIAGLYPFLSKKGLNPDEANVHELATKMNQADPTASFELDLFGTFYSDIKNAILRVMKNSPDQKTLMTNCGTVIGTVIQGVFGPNSKVIVHIDGDRCQEKANTHADRDQRRAKALTRLEILLSDIEKKSNIGKNNSRSKMKEIKKHLKQIIFFYSNDKSDLGDAIKAFNSNFSPCKCPYEADICISEIMYGSQEDIAVSGDSDFLVHRDVSKVLRPIPKGHHKFALYDRAKVLSALGFSTPNQLLLYGVVSNNDYTSNIRGYGLGRNAEIISNLSSLSFQDMLPQYLGVVQTTNPQYNLTYFGHSSNIFIHQTPTKSSGTLPDISDFTKLNDRMMKRIDKKREVRGTGVSSGTTIPGLK